jgi:hypothetical protein
MTNWSPDKPSATEKLVKPIPPEGEGRMETAEMEEGGETRLSFSLGWNKHKDTRLRMG